MMLSTGTPPQPSPAAPTLQQQQQQQSAVAFQPMYPTSDGTGRGQEVRTPSTSMISFQSTGNLSHTSFNAMPMSSTAHSQQQQQSQAYAYAAQQQPQGHPPTTALAYHHQAQPPQQAATWDGNTTYTTTTTAANAAYAAAYAAGAAPQQQQHHQHAATDAQYATAQYATPTQFTYQQQAQPGYGPTPQQQPQAVAYPPPYPPTQQQQQPQQAQAPQTAYWQPAYSPAGPAGHHHIAAGQPQQYAQQQQQQQPLMNAPPPGHHMTAIPAASAQPSYGLVAAHPSGGFVSASSMAAPAGGAEGPKQLIVNYLAPHVTSAQLHQLFSPFGPLDGARVIYDRHSGCPKGYGFVYFKHSQSAVAAIEKMNGYALHGKWLKVGYSTNPLTLAGTATA